jgi:hypothetical protein
MLVSYLVSTHICSYEADRVVAHFKLLFAR